MCHHAHTEEAVDAGGYHGLDQPRSNVMRLVRAISVVAVIEAMPALAAELPSRKPGLWEMKNGVRGPQRAQPDDAAVH